MLIILSPAKTLDFETRFDVPHTSEPRLLDESEKLIKSLRNKSLKALRELMDISDDLARLNADRYEHWTREHSAANSGPALLVFRGDVYQGLEADNLSPGELTWAHDHVRILSGLYGVLRPLDLMQPYRLEMGTNLKTRRGSNLYEFWGERITKLLRSDMSALEKDQDEPPVLLDLASQEYSKAVDKKKLGKPAQIITPVFQDENKGKWTVLGLFAKRARGAMTSWIIRNKITDPAELPGFDELGYRYAPEESTEKKPVFRRKENDRQ